MVCDSVCICVVHAGADILPDGSCVGHSGGLPSNEELPLRED